MCRGSSWPSTSATLSAPRTSPSPCCSPTAPRAIDFRATLKDDGIQTTWYPALHTFTEYRRFAPADGLPRASETADRHCALPLSSSMDEAAVETVVAAVRGALERAAQPS